MLGGCDGGSDVELVQQLAAVGQHEADGLAGAYLDRGRFKERVAELDIDRARGGVGFGGGADAFAVTGAGLGREDGEAESAGEKGGGHKGSLRSEEHTSELQSLMRI